MRHTRTDAGGAVSRLVSLYWCPCHLSISPPLPMTPNLPVTLDGWRMSNTCGKRLLTNEVLVTY